MGERCWFQSWPPGCRVHGGYEVARECTGFPGSLPTAATWPEAPGPVSTTPAGAGRGSRGERPHAAQWDPHSPQPRPSSSATSRRRGGRARPTPSHPTNGRPGRAECPRLRQGNLKQEKSLYRGYKGKSAARDPASREEEDERCQVRASGPEDLKPPTGRQKRPQRQPPTPIAAHAAQDCAGERPEPGTEAQCHLRDRPHT